MTFRVGQKVVCVRGPIYFTKAPHDVCVGKIYTVRELRLSRRNEPGILVDEIHNPIHPKIGREYGFIAARFRPVVERKTDISVFTAMLNPSQVTVDVG